MKTRQPYFFQEVDFIEQKPLAIVAKTTVEDHRIVIDLREADKEMTESAVPYDPDSRVWIKVPRKQIYRYARLFSSKAPSELRAHAKALVNALDGLNFSAKSIETAVVRFNFRSNRSSRATHSFFEKAGVMNICQVSTGDGASIYRAQDGATDKVLLRYLTLEGTLDEVGLTIRAFEDFTTAEDRCPEQVMKYVAEIWEGHLHANEPSVRDQIRRYAQAPETELSPSTIQCLNEIDMAFWAAARFAMSSPLSKTSISLRRKIQTVLSESLAIETGASRPGSRRFLAVLTESLLLAELPERLKMAQADRVHPMKRKTENRIST